MISKVYEWLRAADLQPDDHTVAVRGKAVEQLEKKIRGSKDHGLLLGTVIAAVGGCERLGEQSPVFATILECVRTHSPAFPSAIDENGLHLRMICCLGLGELLNSAEDETSDTDEELASSLLASGLGLKPKEAGQHLDKVFAELAGLARANLQKQAVALREREELDWDEFNALKSIADPGNFNQKLLPAVKKLFESLQQQHALDREELEVMWWLHNGHSEHLGKQLKTTASHLAAVAIGSELADRISHPATVGLTELVTQAAVRDRSVAQLKPKSIGKIVADLGEAGRKLLVPATEHVSRFVRSTGVLLPLSWLCLRLEESGGAIGWDVELRSKAGLASGHELKPGELAVQVFLERQAQRVYQTIVKG